MYTFAEMTHAVRCTVTVKRCGYTARCTITPWDVDTLRCTVHVQDAELCTVRYADTLFVKVKHTVNPQ